MQCSNGGHCNENALDDGSTSAYCSCKPGFTGSRCETGKFYIFKSNLNEKLIFLSKRIFSLFTKWYI